MHSLSETAHIALSQCLELKKNEKILIVTNPDTEQAEIAAALYEQARAMGAQAGLLYQPVKTQADFAEDEVLRAIEARPDVILSISTEKLGKDKARLAAPLAGADGRSYDHIFNYLLHGIQTIRAVWTPGITKDIFVRAVPVDYAAMRDTADRLEALLDEASAVMVRSPRGTDITFSVSGRKAMRDDGDFRNAGAGGNLPAGEVFISPAIKSAEGTIVFDGSISDIAGDIVIRTPIACTVRGGYVMGIEGGEEARRLEKALMHGLNMAATLVRDQGMAPELALSYGTNARHLGEFGIGLNPAARIGGNMLEDEKVMGTIHFAIGANYDEDAPALIHLDGLVKSPTVVLLMPTGEEVAVMEGGALAV
ncbi:putative leucyl aminopeptidase [uncultured spirochete]|uniref:Putative leucyl aminopeptidase n=1 Tax=uncultured spirochete TaxID=156406 RepID=A0A3P3XV06_9SPIR|nr:putative leucyl aminopeptidase [uncultured spirochete]